MDVQTDLSPLQEYCSRMRYVRHHLLFNAIRVKNRAVERLIFLITLIARLIILIAR